MKDYAAPRTMDLIEDLCIVFPHFERFMQKKLEMSSFEAKDLLKASNEPAFWKFFTDHE